jgi:hypothetical protein
MIAECLAASAGWCCLMREDLVSVVNTRGELANRIIETIGRAAENYAKFSVLRRPYKILMRLALLEYVRKGGNVAYFGYSAHLLLPPIAHTIRIRLLASMELRVAHHMAQDNYTKEQAREHIRQVDEERSRWTRFMYGKNLRDPELFDLCINVDRLSVGGVCSVLVDIASHAQFQPQPGSIAAVENLYLATKVLAALVTDPSTAGIEIGAVAENGRVQLEGPYLEEPALAAVLEVAKAVPGVQELEYAEGYSPGFEMAFGHEEVLK